MGYKIVETLHATSLQFYVKDTGIGIPKERQDAIFERFVQADIEDRDARQGAGLGLAISRAYVKMLGGKIWLESEEGSGSTFYFTIPCKTTDQDTSSKTANGQPTRTLGEFKKLKILIAEDDEVSELLTEIVVKPFSREILKVQSGNEALETCHNHPDIDLVLMDIKMPGMDGLEATKRIRAFNKKVVIIAQTAYALLGDREKALEAGCNDYLTKPLKKSDLAELIHKFFD